MKRMVEFAQEYHLHVHLAYYPPYHSKYNPIERCWGILEEHWDTSLLDSAEAVMEVMLGRCFGKALTQWSN